MNIKLAARTNHPGVYEIDNKLWIDFQYEGKRYREFWSLKTTPSEKNKATHERKKICAAISTGTFVYAEFFPNSKHSVKTVIPTFKQLADNWTESVMVRNNTIASYKVGLRFWEPHFSNKLISAINHVEIRGILSKALSVQKLSKKTLNNYLVPIRAVFDDAISLEYISKNPMDKIENFEVQFRKPDPIKNETDIERIITELYKRNAQVANYFGFAFHSGLRVSELIALTWDDYCPDRIPNPVMVVNKRVAYGTLDSTKTYKSRDVILNKKAIVFLEDQKKYTGFKKGAIFENPNTDKPWSSDKFQRNLWWTPVLKYLGIEHNRAYCTRHSYASHLRAKGIPMEFITQQLGHSSVLTTYKYYVGEVPFSTQATCEKINALIDAEFYDEKKSSEM